MEAHKISKKNKKTTDKPLVMNVKNTKKGTTLVLAVMS